jgi:hypothetical protein
MSSRGWPEQAMGAPVQKVTWKRLIGLAGVLGLLAAAAGLLLNRSAGGGCGTLVLGRWSIPVFSAFLLAALLGLGLLLAGIFAPEARCRAVGQGLLAMAVSLGLTLGLLDIGIRLTSPPLQQGAPLVNYAPHPVLEYFRAPDATFRWGDEAAEFLVIHRTDEYGLLAEDGSNTPRPDARRILFLGDSFVAGLHVRMRDNLAQQTAASLAAATGGEDWQAFNVAVDGYSPVHYALTYREFAPVFDPEVVIAGVYVTNDFADTVRLYLEDTVVTGPDGSPVRLVPLDSPERPPLLPEEEWRRGLVNVARQLAYRPLCRAIQWQTIGAQTYFDVPPEELDVPPVVDGSAPSCRDERGDLLPACRNYSTRNEIGIDQAYDAIFKDTYSAADLEGIALSLDMLRLLAGEVAADGRRLVIVIFPDGNQVPGQGEGYKPLRGLAVGQVIESTSPQDLLNAFCAAEGLDCLDMLPVFQAHSAEPLYWVYDTHLTPQGHALAGQTIAAHLLAQPGD